MIRIEDFGEVAYGGVVTLAEWWDNKRIAEGTLATKDVLKKASFYSYLGIGLVATLASSFGWARRWDKWAEHVSHGFLYDLPRFTYNLSKAMGTASSGRSNSAAILEAQRIIREKQLHQLGVGLGAGREAQRSYQPEFEKARAF